MWAQIRAEQSKPTLLAERLETSWGRVPPTGLPPVNHNTIDETNILLRWLSRNDGHPSILPLDLSFDQIEWTTLAGTALALSDDDLVRDAIAPVTDDVELDVVAGNDDA